MAKMIPPSIVDDTNSSEREVFDKLKNDPDTKGWTVLHSIELANRGVGKPYGEIDFVVVIPGEGVLCLEVKGWGIFHRGGKWWREDCHGNEQPLRRSPFKQAKESTNALLEKAKRHFEDSRKGKCPPIGRMVVFPYVECPPVTLEFERWEVIDRDDMPHISSSIKKAVRISRKKLKKPAPAGAETKEIIRFLSPNFDRVPRKDVWIRNSEKALQILTEEQYERLDQVKKNPRCLFEGAAGTGKTLLALEFSRRACREGKKVLLVCYNRLLGQWLREETKDTDIMAGTFHGIMENFIRGTEYERDFNEKKQKKVGDEKQEEELYDQDYPFYAELALEELGPQFDLLVMDEAQDLCQETKLNALDLAIQGRFSGGHWAIFGDFSRQTIYDKTEDPIDALKKFCGVQDIPRFDLTVNCRNTRNIAEEVYRLSGFENPPSRFVREQGPPVKRRYWKDSADFVNKLGGEISSLLQDEISLEGIVLLSSLSLEKSVLSCEKRISGFPVEDCSKELDVLWKKEIVKFSTIHSFKGLESPVVIVVVEAEGLLGDNWESLLYVSMSRAKDLLILMIKQDAKDIVKGNLPS
ncbi:MAG: NERD domain-containing protein [Candidatus Dadabacteria bacterium]|nr:NERD domain-containing protein [Candidatus Dadabacteria bacterium]